VPNRASGSLASGRSNVPLSDAQIRSVSTTFLGLDRTVPFKHDPAGRTRFVVEQDDSGDEVGIVYFGADVYPGANVVDPNSALSMQAAVAHEISHFHRWKDATELPLGEHVHLDEAQTSLDAALRFAATLSAHEIQQLMRDSVQRLQLLRAALSGALPPV
jgi:hypothetical protein